MEYRGGYNLLIQGTVDSTYIYPLLMAMDHYKALTIGGPIPKKWGSKLKRVLFGPFGINPSIALPLFTRIYK